MESAFDMKTCQSKLSEHYKKTAKVPTSVWSKASVDLHQIYTRLSWVKAEQTPAASSQLQLNHYTDLFAANKNGAVPKRILVHGQAGIGKSTFARKLAVDWAELKEERKAEKQKDALKRFEDEEDHRGAGIETSQGDVDVSCKDDEETLTEGCEDTSSDDEDEVMREDQKAAMHKFELVIVANLREASKCQSLRDVICRSIFPEEEIAFTEGLLSYITTNQEKILLVLDGFDEYGCGSNSEVYEIFRGKKLRNCCVLITTRSLTDELQKFEDVRAMITGFSEDDREAFMRRMLGSKTEARELKRHLLQENLEVLARVPLLLVFFCTLWSKGKFRSFAIAKAKLYLAIIQYILDHSQGKNSPSHFDRVQDFNEILIKIGKVALECLLKDDHAFKRDLLSPAMLCKESHIIGLLCVAEYTDSLQPASMVSFIHMSIQEFLAAWYITYRCVPEGNVGVFLEHACTLEDCEALENVFQFICGLSDEGAIKVFQHLTSVRISDPTLDLSKTIPDVDNKTDVPLYDITHRHERFSDLVNTFFLDVCSKAELQRYWLDCSGGIVLVVRGGSLSELRPKVKNASPAEHSVSVHYSEDKQDIGCNAVSLLLEKLKFLDCLDGPLRVTERSKVLEVGDFARKFMNVEHCRLCEFSSILCFHDDQFQFYVPDLQLWCDDHARFFTDLTTTISPSLSEAHSCLKFLRSLRCINCLDSQPMRDIGAAIRNGKYLRSIEINGRNDYISDLLEQVPNPSGCSLKITSTLTSVKAVKLAVLLPRFKNITVLNLDLSGCCTAAVDTLVVSITHNTLQELELSGISLSPAAAVSLGRSLPEMSSLQIFKLTGVDGSILQAEEMEAVFGGFNKTLPLHWLTFSGFNVRGCLAPLTKSFRFFPNLRELCFGEFNLDERNLCCLLESLRFIPNLEKLSAKGKPFGDAHCCTAEVNTVCSFTHKTLKELFLNEISLTPVVAMVLGRSLPEVSSLQILKLTGVDGSILQAEEMETVFGGFNKTLPLHWLTFNGFNVRGCLIPLTKSFRFFPNLRELCVGEFHLDEHNLCSLLESLRLIPNLEKLSAKGKLFGDAHCCTAEVNTIRSFTHETLKELLLNEISLTPAAATVLGRSLPEMSSLQILELIGVDGSILQAEEMEALFGGMKKISPLLKLTFNGFSVRGCLAPLTNSLRFFPNLRELYLIKLNLDEYDLCGLLESLRFTPFLRVLSLVGNPTCNAGTFVRHANTMLPKLQDLSIQQRSCSEEDLSSVRDAINQLRQVRPKLIVFLSL